MGQFDEGVRNMVMCLVCDEFVLALVACKVPVALFRLLFVAVAMVLSGMKKKRMKEGYLAGYMKQKESYVCIFDAVLLSQQRQLP